MPVGYRGYTNIHNVAMTTMLHLLDYPLLQFLLRAT